MSGAPSVARDGCTAESRGSGRSRDWSRVPGLKTSRGTYQASRLGQPRALPGLAGSRVPHTVLDDTAPRPSL